MSIKHIVFFALLALSFTTSCKKKTSGGSTPVIPPVQEAQIAFRTDPNPGNNVYTSLSSPFTFQVVLTSTMPADGISIDITAKNVANNEALGSPINYKSRVASNNFSIGPLVSGVTYSVTIVVSSQKVSSPLNTATKSFSIKLK